VRDLDKDFHAVNFSMDMYGSQQKKHRYFVVHFWTDAEGAGDPPLVVTVSNRAYKKKIQTRR